MKDNQIISNINLLEDEEEEASQINETKSKTFENILKKKKNQK